ncbi:glycerol-3-phosphate dehydrogenase/oxidase [Marinobacter zhanjiangensis]|uniref:FAD-dependent glycerol-3-phosphate dehydrogenase n=1 Tax=Marinobacter zhanjiangensis TaxID=578215 RepID=A0ABQ3ATP1_9GAMM|nr:glycerol-3-phosphate dehydrogenase/oxidase [Marinobacter zhanjiangensis]GGY66984.1 FAD-dependent glycerol-3-phosphate dehydrogenase [Marinobacter zhanjiangensis]
MSSFELNPHYDVLIIGGGITGAGVAREAAAAGLATLLVEQKDFAWGTSSRSSKMVHGGLRYLAAGHLSLTRDSVRERQRMLDQAPGLVDRMRYVMPHYRGSFPGPWLFGKVLWLYDRFGGERYRHRINIIEMLQWLPGLKTEGLKAASGFSDAVTDDARLVLRVLDEARSLGAETHNYLRVTRVEKSEDAPWSVTLEDQRPEQPAEQTLSASVVVNATGAWADRLWRESHGKEHIRPLRGSHIVVPFRRLPVSVSLTLSHPRDKRPVFIFPWLGRTVIGTTDLDHTDNLDHEPRISTEELTYLFQAVENAFPAAAIDRSDVISTWAGIRPVVTWKTRRAPSDESREHVIWDEGGLVSVAGGKLTTFRRIARDVLVIGAPRLTHMMLQDDDTPMFRAAPPLRRPPEIRHLTWRRLRGQYGPRLGQVLEAGPLQEIPGSQYLWAELHWAARNESVVHLDDLLLRRSRLGLILPEGARALLPEIRQRLALELDWSDDDWQGEIHRYLGLWHAAYHLPTEPETP